MHHACMLPPALPVPPPGDDPESLLQPQPPRAAARPPALPELWRLLRPFVPQRPA